MDSFGTTDPVVPLVAALFGLPVAAVVIVKVRQCAVYGAWLVVASACLNALLLGQIPLLHAGVSVYFVDLAYGALATAALTRIGANLSIAPIPTTWIAFTAVMLLSCLLGLSSVGTGAGVEFRDNFCLLAASTYFAVTATAKDLYERIPKVLIFGGVLISIVVLARWTFPGASMSLHADVMGLEGRAIPASSAFVVLVGAFLLIHNALTRGISTWQATSLFLLVFVAVSVRHRTVWFAAIGGFFFLALYQRQGRQKLIGYGFGLIAVGMAASLVIFQSGIGPFERMAERLTDFGSTSSGTGTFRERYVGWLDLLDQYAEWTYRDQLFGRPFGLGFKRTVVLDGETRIAEASPHNYYVELLFRVGLIGLLMFALTIGVQLVRLVQLRSSPSSGNCAILYSALIVMGSIYAITYRVPEIFGAILGCSFAVLRLIPPNAAFLRWTCNGRHRPPHLPQSSSEDSRLPEIATR